MIRELANELDEIKFKHLKQGSKSESKPENSLDYYDWWLKYYESKNVRLLETNSKLVKPNAYIISDIEKSDDSHDSDHGPNTKTRPIRGCCMCKSQKKNKKVIYFEI